MATAVDKVCRHFDVRNQQRCCSLVYILRNSALAASANLGYISVIIIIIIIKSSRQ